MPEHNNWFNTIVFKQFKVMKPTHACDVGPGKGIWGRYLRQAYAPCFIQAIEIWEPYIDKYALDKVYNEIIIGDARKVRFDSGTVVIFGDVLEHMSEKEALALVERAAKSFYFIIICAPLGPYPQGPTDGNPYEEHQCELWPEMFSEYQEIERHIARNEDDYNVGLFNLLVKGERK